MALAALVFPLTILLAGEGRDTSVAVDAFGPVIGVLALQGDVREHMRILRASGAEVVRVRRASELGDIDGIVIPGGESTTMAKLAAELGLLQPLHDAIAAGLPAYGSCAGMIMLADKLVDAADDQQTVGGIDAVVRRNAFGRQVDSFEGELAFQGIDGPVHAVFIRAPWVESVGGDVDVLARVMDGPAAGMIVAAQQGNVLATAFHPELTGDDRVHRLFLELVHRARGARSVPPSSSRSPGERAATDE